MPTYREFEINDEGNTRLIIPVDFDKWKKYLGDEYIILIRAHYAVVESLNIKEDDFIIDVSKYAPLN